MKVLYADRVLAGADLTPIDHGAVVVDGTTIRWIGPRAELPSPGSDLLDPEAEIVDLGDATILPGLIDAHVHLGFDGSAEPVARMMRESDAQQVATMLASARQLLSVGVTTARDLGARGYLDVVVREAILDGTARGPRMVTAGPAITVTGGHCWFMGAEVDSVEDMRRTVRRHHKAGVDAIKLMATGGNMTRGSAPWHAQFTVEEIRAAVDEAHRLGKKVAAHAHGVEGIRRSLAAGVDTLEHCSFQGKDGWGDIDPALVDAIAAADVHVSPTCNFRMPQLRELLPERSFAVGLLYEAGASIIASTDAGIDNTPHHGFVGGLEALAGFGLSAPDVLAAATTRAAEALDVADVTGRLAAGYAADLIAVGGDPRADVGALHDLRYVMTRGSRFVPDALPPLPEVDLSSSPILAAMRAAMHSEGAGLRDSTDSGAGPQADRAPADGAGVPAGKGT
ncbi:metal-dependent hydrolase family protein [Georgenia deserti]|uniref:Amidohydrolase family protein n=1 Tax=Georgenia deserti TaxID=2093781 RepID=A0ABW4L3T9_9MICO